MMLSILVRSDDIKGFIYKLLSGNYYVEAEGNNYVCRARGLFRLDNTTLLVGDYVEIEVDQFEKDKAYIIKRLARKNELIRPAVANIEQSIIVMALKKPNLNFYLLDKMLLMSELAGIKPIIVINKLDISETKEMAEFKKVYKYTTYPIIFTSAENEENLSELKAALQNSISAFSGPSGVGKSTLLNKLLPNSQLKTGAISQKIGRGKHTTRHSELIKLANNSYVLDTPGFTSLDISGVSITDLADYFPEMQPYQKHCKYNDCLHKNEVDCAVKKALAENKISESRYRSYLMMSSELEQKRSY